MDEIRSGEFIVRSTNRGYSGTIFFLIMLLSNLVQFEVTVFLIFVSIEFSKIQTVSVEIKDEMVYRQSHLKYKIR